LSSVLLGARAVECLVLAHLRLFYLLCGRPRRGQTDPRDAADALQLVGAGRLAEVVVALLGHDPGRPRLAQLDLQHFVLALDVLQLRIVESLLGRHLVLRGVVLLRVPRDARVHSVHAGPRLVVAVGFDV
jgi:hypothetical protein